MRGGEADGRREGWEARRMGGGAKGGLGRRRGGEEGRRGGWEEGRTGGEKDGGEAKGGVGRRGGSEGPRGEERRREMMPLLVFKIMNIRTSVQDNEYPHKTQDNEYPHKCSR